MPRRTAHDFEKFQLDWDKILGEGMFGNIYEGVACRVVNRPVAIKIFTGDKFGDRARQADAELRRYVALPRHPHLLKLLGIGFYPQALKQNLRLVWFMGAMTQT